VTFEKWKESVKDVLRLGYTDLDLLQSAYNEGYKTGYIDGYENAETEIEEKDG